MKKAVKVILIVVGSLAALALIVVAGLGYYAQRNMGDIITKEFAKATDGRYTIAMEDVDVSFFDRSVCIKGLVLKSDSTAPDADKSMEAVKAEVGLLKLAGLKIKRTNGRMSVAARKIRMEHADLDLRMSRMADTVSHGAGKVSEMPEHISVNKLEIMDATVRYVDVSKTDTLEFRADDVAIQARNINIGKGDSIAVEDFNLFAVSLSRVSVLNMNNLRVDSLNVSSSEGMITLASFLVEPTETKAEFAYKNYRHADWTKINTGRVAFSGVDFRTMLNYGVVKIDSMAVDRLLVSSCKNRKIARKEWVKPMYHTVIQQLPATVDIRVIGITKSRAEYEELAEKGDHAGRLFFSDIYGHIDGFTNRPSSRDQLIKINAHAMLMGKGAVNANFHFPVDPSNDFFELTGVIGRMNFTDINPMLQPLVGNVSVQGGVLKNFNVYMSGNHAKANVKMTVLYDDLKISVLKNNKGHTKRRGLLSSLVNTVVVHNSNPDRRGTRHSEVSVERDPYRSPFNYIWRGVFAGLKDTILLPDI